MTIQSAALQKIVAAHDTFYVVKQCCPPSTSDAVMVVHQVPMGAEELGSFDTPNQAIDFAEAAVRERHAIGSLLELVDPPHGLVGGG